MRQELSFLSFFPNNDKGNKRNKEALIRKNRKLEKLSASVMHKAELVNDEFYLAKTYKKCVQGAA